MNPNECITARMSRVDILFPIVDKRLVEDGEVDLYMELSRAQADLSAKNHPLFVDRGDDSDRYYEPTLYRFAQKYGADRLICRTYHCEGEDDIWADRLGRTWTYAGVRTGEPAIASSKPLTVEHVSDLWVHRNRALSEGHPDQLWYEDGATPSAPGFSSADLPDPEARTPAASSASD